MPADKFLMNRLGNAKNYNQGEYKRVLCVCSAGLLRSPTTALVLSQAPYNYNTRAAGIEETYALVQIDRVLLSWADEIVCMSEDQKTRLEKKLKDFGYNTPVYCLDVPDCYPYRDPKLIKAIKKAYNEATKQAGSDEESGQKST
jgi:predicted protein tyrosine phosphatase